MDAASEVGYGPPPEFQEDVKDPLIELSLSDSTELWLIQWPINQAPDFDGQELSLKLHRDGLLGSFEGSSGKSYDVVSFKAQDPNATVFISSASESKIVGKISRRVSLVHYPEPSELEKQNINNQRQMYQRSTGTSLTSSSRHRAPSRSIWPSSSNAASKHSSKSKSSLSEAGEASKPPKRSRIEEPARSMEQQSTQDSGRGHSTVTSSGSFGHSNDRKSKKKKHEK
ncbi:Mediator-associated protein [Actinidia chinensis var. chinensis]|uniref:Mediator-associated protein n=1 Tax=Actinidia chinensis var. chinensis TaxID=1590841 RepID=A0A2R6P2W8_ACTCC|nr:Mediator-associated protein [Actinidia chinensis var. chinensis]